MGDEVGDTGKTLEAKRHNESHVRVTYKKKSLYTGNRSIGKDTGLSFEDVR